MTGAPGGMARSEQVWWSDALNDPWRNPETAAVVLTTADPAPPPEPDRALTAPSRSIGQLVAIVAATGLLAGALGGALGYYAATRPGAASSALGPRVPAPPPLRTSDSLPALIDRVMPSVVTVEAATRSGVSVGSGFVITQEGHILTNDHVVAEVESIGVRVTLADNTSLPARLVGRDVESDLAVLKVDRDDLRPVEFADSDVVAVGDGVLAIGAPLALPGTVTSGIVSAVDRPIETRDSGGVKRYYAAIQTDAAVNQGNSGGPLFDMGGRVIGVNAVIKSVVESGESNGNIGIAFAIPINHAGRVAGEIIDTGRARRTVIGAQLVQDRAIGGGVRLTAVDAGGPAADAGLRAGDVVVRLGNHQIRQPYDLIALVRRHDPGTTVTVTVRRGGETQIANVVLTADSN